MILKEELPPRKNFGASKVAKSRVESQPFFDS